MSKRAIIFLNMGAPRDLNEVELFLKNMFNDKNIITTKSATLRRFIAGMITLLRSKEAKNNYKKIGGTSPLVAKTKEFLDRFEEIYADDEVVNIMRYTPPFANEVIEELKTKDIEKVILFPLYPHYSTTTIKSSLGDFYHIASKLDFKPSIRVIKPYYKDELYNQAIIQTIKDQIQNSKIDEIDLIFSAHSLPQKIVDKGDSYQQEVIEHTKILTSMLKDQGLIFRSYNLAYQSKLGPVKWLEPALDEMIKKSQNKKALIVPISFTLDNSETIFELDVEYRELANELGFSYYKVASAPNSSPLLLQSFTRLIDDQ